MDTPPGTQRQQQRPFKPVCVGRCHRQTAADRFGPEGPSIVRENELVGGALSDASSSSQGSIWQGASRFTNKPDVPHMQKHRNNLTALAQSCNLYFVAYQSDIYVYRPRTAVRNALPRDPDLRLCPSQTYAASIVGGYVNPYRPHTIDQIVTGFLGSHEIVVVCYDDGDVIAYYIKTIMSYMSGEKPITKGGPRPFFADNVGFSAWGLAVHQKSRLIAVSSNLREVTVFAFALSTPDTKGHAEDRDEDEIMSDVEARVRQRRAHWRIIIALGKTASNIPNVCFMDDQQGYAEKVCAVDIDASVWIAHIWKPKQPVTHIKPTEDPMFVSEEYYPRPAKGWGIVAIPEQHFMVVDSVEELTGLSTADETEAAKDANRKCTARHKPRNLIATIRGDNETPMIDLDRSLFAVADNPCPPSSSWLSHNHTRTLIADVHDAIIHENHDLNDLNDFSDVDGELDDDSIMSFHTMETVDEGTDEDLDNFEAVEQHLAGWLDVATAPTASWTSLPQFSVLQGADHALLQGLQAAYPTVLSNVAKLWTPTRSDNAEPEGLAHIEELNMIYRPHTGKVVPGPTGNRERKEFLMRTQQQPCWNSVPYVATEDTSSDDSLRYRILRTYEKEMDLQTSWQPVASRETLETRMMCSNALPCQQLRAFDVRRHFQTTSRMSMIAYIPEISLVVIGSPSGRVLLATLTRLASPLLLSSSKSAYYHTGFRVEGVLPRASDEMVHRQVMRPLHGIAVSPVMVDGGESRKTRATDMRRYRLMLHYRNHDILSYEMTRDEETKKLCIF